MSDVEEESEDFAAADLIDLAEFVERMVAVAQRGGMSSISIETDGLKLSMKSGTAAEKVVKPAPSPVASADNQSAVPVQQLGGHLITAPMVGTFYHSPSPSDPPLVLVGDRVEAGQLIGIIEAMKIMNEITADGSGTVTEIIAPNATPVEYGSPLIRLGP